MKVWQITIIVFAIWIFSVNKIQAEGILFQDNFSHNSLSNWKMVRNQEWDDLSQPCFNQNMPAEWQILGGKLGMVIDGPNCTSEIVPRFIDMSNIHSYQYDFDLTLNETTLANRNVVFHWQSGQNWYGIRIFDQIVILQKMINNQYVTLENSYRFPFFANNSYHFTIIVRNESQITLKINNVEAFEFPDRLQDISGFKTVGFQASNGSFPRSVSFFDNVVIRSLDPGMRLDVPLIKQIDPQWKDTEYDSAQKWSEELGIGRWGCSLTSVVMVFRYYGINFLPDGTYLNPTSLNIWLKSQVDGYVGEGALNWLAISRLSKKIHDRYGTTKLEFNRKKGDIEIAKEQIKLQRPVILRIDGHFLVADGVTEDDQDLLTKDPAFKYTQFNQYRTKILAIETFTPSFTDLSYFLMSHQSELSVRLLNDQGIEVSNFEEGAENIRAFESETGKSGAQFTRTTIEHLYSKPIEGTYILEVRSSKPGEYPFHFFTYDSDGNLTNLSQSTFFNREPKYFTLTFTKNISTLKHIISLSTFRQDLGIGKELKMIEERSWKKLDGEAEFSEFSGETRQLRYIGLLQALITSFSSTIRSELSFILQDDLTELNQQLNAIISR